MDIQVVTFALSMIIIIATIVSFVKQTNKSISEKKSVDIDKEIVTTVPPPQTLDEWKRNGLHTLSPESAEIWVEPDYAAVIDDMTDRLPDKVIDDFANSISSLSGCHTYLVPHKKRKRWMVAYVCKDEDHSKILRVQLLPHRKYIPYPSSSSSSSNALMLDTTYT